MGRYKIYYELYKNDLDRKSGLIKEADSLKEIEDWLTDFASPVYADRKSLHMGFRGLNVVGRIQAYDRDRQEDLWVHQIVLDGMIVYSDGKFTNEKTFATDEVRNWAKGVEERYLMPKFNFAPTSYSENNDKANELSDKGERIEEKKEPFNKRPDLGIGL